ncbi:hypothetical protein NC652_035824 [Populus alba x Populus x berolinensis]|nr:hypothetical protein NC652_035824 [Populus alba x Populus x berolinensis]
MHVFKLRPTFNLIVATWINTSRRKKKVKQCSAICCCLTSNCLSSMEYKEGQKKGTRHEKGGWVLVKLPACLPGWCCC